MLRQAASFLSPLSPAAPGGLQLAAALWTAVGRGAWSPGGGLARRMSSAADEVEREVMDYDVVIVGGGPAGLSAAIKIKQECEKADKELSVCVLEKGADVGAHILSGNVLQPTALDNLFPDWREDETVPIKTAVKTDRFYFLNKWMKLRMPTPKQMHNKGNYVVSLSEVTAWLGGKAEEMDIDIFPGFAAAGVVKRPDGSVGGVVTGDFGIAKDGSVKDMHQPGMEIHAKVTLLAEGCRGSVSEEVIRDFKLREAVQAEPQSYGLGIKEVWEVDPNKHQEGLCIHTIGWPLDTKTYGGSFLYHMADNKVSLGFVVGLDYENPYLSPYQEFQRWKSHPSIKGLLEGGTCLQYGARTLNEGGLQSIPGLTFPGGAIIGCSAGFLNVAKIKGTHTAMWSGIEAGDTVFKALTEEPAEDEEGELILPVDLSAYPERMKKSFVWSELEEVRNIRPGFQWGLLPGLVNAALETYVWPLVGGSPYTLKLPHADHECLKPKEEYTPIDYPKPDGEITFDRVTSVYRSGTNHDDDQPIHLVLRNEGIPDVVNMPLYDGPEQRYCPAGVYEYVEDEETHEPKLVINAQNCLHCKACSIKDPTQNIKWTVPEGGGGPAYSMT